MKAKRKTLAIVLLSFLFVPTKTQAQFYSDMSIGLNGGVYIYQGDLTPHPIGSIPTARPGLSLFAKKPINHFLAARIHISIASLRGNEAVYAKPDYRRQRNFAFTTPVKEFSGQLVWNILGRNYADYGIMPYLFSGAGVAIIRVAKDYSRLDPTIFSESSDVIAGLAIDNARGTPPVLFSVPVGIGAEYPLSYRFSINVETSYRFVFSDYLDGFSYAANPNLRDNFHSTSAGIIYKFGKKNKGIGCPTVN